MPGCTAAACNNSAKKGFTMIRFPKDPVKREAWQVRVARNNCAPITDGSRLCEAHFAPEMWEKTREDGTQRLKPDAVPTIFGYFMPKPKRKSPWIRTDLLPSSKINPKFSSNGSKAGVEIPKAIKRKLQRNDNFKGQPSKKAKQTSLKNVEADLDETVLYSKLNSDFVPNVNRKSSLGHKTYLNRKTTSGQKSIFDQKQFVAQFTQNLNSFNGEKIVGKRVRKPNSKFFDYIIPSSYILTEDQDTDEHSDRSDADVGTLLKAKAMKEAKPRLQKARVKERILAETEDEQKIDTHSSVDPLDIQHTDDVVHSFLPVFEPSPVLDYNDDVSDEPLQEEPGTSNVKEKPAEWVSSKPVAKPTDFKNQPIRILSPSWNAAENSTSAIFGKVLCMPLILATNTGGAPDNVNKQLTIVNKPEQRWVQIQPKPEHGSPAVNKQLTPIDIKLNNENMSVALNSNVSVTRTKTKLNGTNVPKPKSSKVLSPSRFILVNTDVKYKPTKLSDIDFNKLVRSLKSVKLPAKNWKIRIIVSPQETITEVIFTNKETVERCVKFSRAVNAGYKVTFGKSEVKLLGAPTIQTFDDIAILLEIIHTLSANSLVLEYC